MFVICQHKMCSALVANNLKKIYYWLKLVGILKINLSIKYYFQCVTQNNLFQPTVLKGLKRNMNNQSLTGACHRDVFIMHSSKLLPPKEQCRMQPREMDQPLIADRQYSSIHACIHQETALSVCKQWRVSLPDLIFKTY